MKETEYWEEENCCGHYDENGKKIVDEFIEEGSDRDFGTYDSEVMNGYGYYNEDGKFIRTYYGD